MLPHNIFDLHTHIGLDVCHYDLTKVDPSLSVEQASHIWEWYGKITLDPLTVFPLPYSKEWVKALLDLQKNISIITARSDREAWKVERTKAWVQTYFPEIGESRISFVNHFHEESRPKSIACREHGVTLMIDDSIENAYDLSNGGIACILLEKPWNRDIEFSHPLLYRIKDWTEILGNLKTS